MFYTRKHILHKKGLTKLICKLLSKFYCYRRQQTWDVNLSNFHHFKIILTQSLSPPLKNNLTKHVQTFLAFDPRELPENIGEIARCGNDELDILIIHYCKMKEDAFNSITNTQNLGIDEGKTPVKWQGFEHFMYLKRDAHRCKIGNEM